MLEITVKTLDGRNRTFSVADDITVRQFKEEIASSIEIEAGVQRLIFQGRVLADEKKINDYDVNGKTIHVVLRPPPQARPPSANQANEESRNPRNVDFAFHGARHTAPSVDLHINMGSSDQARQSEAQNRIDQAKKMLKSAKETLDKIDNPIAEQTGNATTTITDTSVDAEGSEETTTRTTTTTTTTTDLETGQTTSHTTTTSDRNQTGQQQEPPEDPQITTLADVFDDVLTFNNTLNQHIEKYRDIVRQDATLTDISPEEVAKMKRTCELTSEALHYMSHVYHNISDLSIDIDQEPPRRLHAPTPPPRQATAIIQQTIPVQVSAQFSLSPIMRDAEHAPAVNLTTSTTTTTTTTFAASRPTTTSTTTSSTNFPPGMFPPGIPQIHFAMSSNEGSPMVGGGQMGGQVMGGPIPGGHMIGIPMMGGSMFPMMNGGMLNFPGMSGQMAGGVPITTTTSNITTTSQTGESTTTTTRRNVENSTAGNTSANFPQFNFNGEPPAFFNEDFLQNIIQAATHALQDTTPNNGQQVFMMGTPQSFQPVSTGTNQIPQHVSSSAVPSAPTTTIADALRPPIINTTTSRASNNRATTNANRAARELQNNLFSSLFGPPTDPFLPCHSRHFVSRLPQQLQQQRQQQQTTSSNNQAPSNVVMEQSLAGLVSNLVSTMGVNRAGNNENSTTANNITQEPQIRQQSSSNNNPLLGLFMPRVTQTPATTSTTTTTQQQPPQLVDPLLARLVQGTFSSFFTQNNEPVANFLRTLGQDFILQEGEGLFTDFVVVLARYLTFSDFLEIFLGNRQSIRKLHQPLKTFVKDKILVGRADTEENIREAADGIMNSFDGDIREIAEIVVAREDIDFVASARSYLRSQLIHNVQLISSSNNEVTFADDFYESVRSSLFGFVNLCRYCLRDGDRSIEQLAQNRLQPLLSDQSPAVRAWVNQMTLDQLRAILPNVTVDHEAISCYVIHRSAGDHVIATDQDSIDDDSNGSYTSASANILERMDIDDNITYSPVSPTVHDQHLQHFINNDMDIRNPRLPEEVLAHLPLPPSDDNDCKDDEVAENVDWHSIVPEEWVPVITKDGVRQRKQASENTLQLFSEAYLSGVPKKRRKMMKDRSSGEASFPPGSELGIELSESIRLAANDLNIQPITSFHELNADLASSPGLMGAYKEEIKDTIRKRLSEDINYSSYQYPNAEKYFGSNKK